MELRVFLDGQFAPADLLPLSAEDVFQVGDFLGGSVAGGAGGQGRLDHLAHVQQLAHQRALANQHGGQWVDERVGRDVADDRTVALAGLHQPRELQSADGVPHRAAAHPEHHAQLSLGGKLVAGLQSAFDDEALDLLGDLFVQAGPADRLELWLEDAQHGGCPHQRSGHQTTTCFKIHLPPAVKGVVELGRSRSAPRWERRSR